MQCVVLFYSFQHKHSDAECGLENLKYEQVKINHFCVCCTVQ